MSMLESIEPPVFSFSELPTKSRTTSQSSRHSGIDKQKSDPAFSFSELQPKAPDPTESDAESDEQPMFSFSELPSKRKTASQFSRRSGTDNLGRRESHADLQLRGSSSYTVKTALWICLVHVAGVLSESMSLMCKPLSYLFVAWLLSLMMGHIVLTLRASLEPFCIVPGIGSFLCSTEHTIPTLPISPTTSAFPQWADYPGLMYAQSQTFEQLLDDSVGGSGLSLEIKKAEIATSDLITLVKFSKLTSKDLLVETLRDFVRDARRAGRGLQRLGSKFGGAVDQILAVNDHAINTIQAAQTSSPSLIYSIVPFYSPPSIEDVILRTFTDAMAVLCVSIQRLIMEAEIQVTNLERLEEHLSMLHELVSREDSTIVSAKSELLSELWTRLGGNRHTLKGYDNHLALLRGLGEHRKQALAHVISALQALQALSDDMEDMRERVSEPQLAGSSIPIEVHMKSIQIGLQRLTDSRVKAGERKEEVIQRALGADYPLSLGG
ncbi:hypothetical protein EV360DRAFT_84650 [Lentinula raphanica]|nr:hypothetical protein EV360DRAFT_84650 [Lentinula raphanica]